MKKQYNAKHHNFSNGLTYKQKLWADKYIEYKGHGTKSALEAYDTDDNNVAHNIASTNLLKPTIKNYLESIVNNNKDKIKDVVNNGLSAYKITEYQGDANITNLPDYTERRKYTDMLLKYTIPPNTGNPSISLTYNKYSNYSTEQLTQLIKSLIGQ